MGQSCGVFCTPYLFSIQGISARIAVSIWLLAIVRNPYPRYIFYHLYLTSQSGSFILYKGVVDRSNVENTRVLGICVCIVLVNASIVFLITSNKVDDVFARLGILRNGYQEGNPDGITPVAPTSRNILRYFLLTLEPMPRIFAFLEGCIAELLILLKRT